MHTRYNIPRKCVAQSGCGVYVKLFFCFFSLLPPPPMKIDGIIRIAIYGTSGGRLKLQIRKTTQAFDSIAAATADRRLLYNVRYTSIVIGNRFAR